MLSESASYALRAVAALAERRVGTCVSASELAALAEAPRSYLIGLLETLSRHGLVSAPRGSGRRFSLTRSARFISLREVAEPFDGEATWKRCLLGGKECSDDNPCVMHAKWRWLRTTYIKLLEATTIADIAGHRELIERLRHPEQPVRPPAKMRSPRPAHAPSFMLGLSEASRRWLDAVAESLVLRRNGILFDQGDTIDHLYIVKSGLVKLYRHRDHKQEQIVCLVESGGIVAAPALFAGGSVSASAAALKRTEVLGITERDLRGELDRNTNLAHSLICAMADRIHRMTRHLEIVVRGAPKERVAYYLSELLGKQSMYVNTVKIDIRKCDLSAYLGITPETLSRTFRKLVLEGIIEIHGREVRVLERSAIERHSRGEPKGAP